MTAPLIIDADSHVTEPADVWTSRVPGRYADQVPRMVRSDDGRDVWVVNGRVVASVGVTAPVVWEGHPSGWPARLEECHPAAYDAAERLRYMDEAGIWAQVLYPNVGGFGNQNFMEIPDADLKLLAVQVYNDFLEEWASADPRRLVTIMSIPFWDVDAAVGEIERGVAHGHRGVLFTGEPQRFGLPYLGDRHWDRLWAAAQDAGLPIHFHLGGGDDGTVMTAATSSGRHAAHGVMMADAFLGVDLTMKNALQCADLILSGLLPRFPELKFVSVESGIGWIPFVLETADRNYLGFGARRDLDANELMPSELFRRQVFCTFWYEQIAPRRLLDELPVDNILFETDFPHITGLYGNVRQTIEACLSDTPAPVRDKFLWQNAARLYGIDVPRNA